MNKVTFAVLAAISVEMEEFESKHAPILVGNLNKRIDIVISQKGLHLEHVCFSYNFACTLYLHHLLIHCWKHVYLSNKTNEVVYLNYVIIPCLYSFFKKITYAWNSIRYHGTRCTLVLDNLEQMKLRNWYVKCMPNLYLY